MGRPTDYSQEMVDMAASYLLNHHDLGDAVPTIAGLAYELGISRETCYDWAKQPEKRAFSDIFSRVQVLQERKLINGGLTGGFNPAVTKMMLTKHGYSDRIEQDHQSSDGSMKPVERITIEVLDAAKHSGD